jgi:hypothetical protein
MPEATVGPPVSELSAGLTAGQLPSHIASTAGDDTSVEPLEVMGDGPSAEGHFECQDGVCATHRDVRVGEACVRLALGCLVYWRSPVSEQNNAMVYCLLFDK